jgi:hypothetical protein
MSYTEDRVLVPVIAIVTKFDIFVQDELQKLEESAEEEGIDIDDDASEKLASQKATDIFQRHYMAPLMALPHPPRAVLPLSESESPCQIQ